MNSAAKEIRLSILINDGSKKTFDARECFSSLLAVMIESIEMNLSAYKTVRDERERESYIEAQATTDLAVLTKVA